MGLFGSKMRIPMRMMLAGTQEDTPDAPGPSMQVTQPQAMPTQAAPRRRGGLFGGAMRALNPFDAEASFGDFLLGGYDRVDRLRGMQEKAAAKAEREEMLVRLASDPNIPESVRGFLPYAPDAVLSGVIGGRMKQAFPEPQKAQGPLAIGPGTELIDRDPVTGMPIIDPATGKPRVIYSNTNYAPRNSRAPVMTSDPVADNPDLEWER